MTEEAANQRHLFDSLNIEKAKLWMQVDCRYRRLRSPAWGKVWATGRRGWVSRSEVEAYPRKILYAAYEILCVLLKSEKKKFFMNGTVKS